MASPPVHPLLPITSPCFQTTPTKQFLQQLSDRDQAKVLDLQNAFFPFKKILKSFYLKLFSWRISQPFPPKQLCGQSHRAIVLRLTGRGMEWDAEITLAIIATRDRTLQSHSLTFCSEPQPYFLLLAWPRLKAGLWESYLPSLRLSISVSYSVK